MTLETYLEQSKLTRGQFAEVLGITSEAVRRYLAGTRIPSRSIMAEITRVTNGKVTANDFFEMAA